VREAALGRHLEHVDAGPGVEHRAAVGQRDRGERVRHPVGAELRPLERVDRDVDLRRRSVADLLAVVEHRRLVLLALSDHDGAVHRDVVEHHAHRVDRRPVCRLLLAAPDPARARQGGVLGRPNELEREVAVGPALVGAAAGSALVGHPCLHLRA
jgi:hypothetical protein